MERMAPLEGLEKIEVMVTDGWQDFELVDSGDGKKLERFGQVRLVKPEPQAIWKPKLPASEWQKADAEFIPGKGETGRWNYGRNLPESWRIEYKDLSFLTRFTAFKHNGLFPEQAPQWDFIANCVRSRSGKTTVLNLFGYTGIASLAAANAGAEVVHVDASKKAIGWAKENQVVCGVPKGSIRFILDDAVKFVQREIRRGRKYDAIILDPPSFGRGPNNELWRFSEDFSDLVASCQHLMSKDPLFFIANTYAIRASSLTVQNVLREYMPGGSVKAYEIALREKSGGRLLSTAISALWTNDNGSRK